MSDKWSDKWIEIPVEDLRAGDVIVQFTRKAWEKPNDTYWASGGMRCRPVTRVGKHGGLDYAFSGDYPAIQLQCHADGSNQVTRLRVLRTTAADPRFPHDCPHCGKKCWHGFSRIEHAVEDGSCAAR